MGNAEGHVVRNVDKRTSRREHRETFIRAIRNYRQKGMCPSGLPIITPEEGRRTEEKGPAAANIRVMIRKRPFFEHEEKEKEFDVITAFDNEGQIVVHDARMKSDMQHMFMQHHGFVSHRVFNEKTKNEEVYHEIADLLDDVAKGGRGCVMMYGQTGSGKTYTMTSLYKRAAEHLFERFAEEDEANGDGEPPMRKVTLTFVELTGDDIFDMLNARAKLTWAKGGYAESVPQVMCEVPCNSAADMHELIAHAIRLRATEATGVHDASSRSHAMCQVRIEYLKKDPYGDEPIHAGTPDALLTLVDLAGSEHRIDSSEHNAERRKESALINSSLCALKNCIRGISEGRRAVPYRESKLTQMLRRCLSEPHAQLTVICTVSPASKDTEHSLNTLRHSCVMTGLNPIQEEGASSNYAFQTQTFFSFVDVFRRNFDE